jgi:hypothetical protein
MSTERTPKSDKELWQRFAQFDAMGGNGGRNGRNRAPVAVSELDFAAWLEGRLPEARAARIEEAVSADGEMRRAALELADILGKPLPAAPARLEVRARALVGFEAERSTGNASTRFGLFDWLFAGGRRFALQRAMALTAAVMIAASGFMMGGGLGASIAHQRYASTTTVSTGSSNSNDSSEFLGSDWI